MGLRLPRSLGQLRDLDVGHYLVDEASPTRAREVHIRCPLCSTTTLLDDDKHVVAGDGRVMPAFACPTWQILI